MNSTTTKTATVYTAQDSYLALIASRYGVLINDLTRGRLNLTEQGESPDKIWAWGADYTYSKGIRQNLLVSDLLELAGYEVAE